MTTKREKTAYPRQLWIDVLEVAATSVAAILVLATLVWETKHYLSTPIYDDLMDHLRMYRAFPSISEFLKYLVSPHNEHRILTTRLVAFIDEFVFLGREYTQLIVTSALQLLSACLVYRFVLRPELKDNWVESDKFLAFFTVTLLFINPNFLYTLIVPFQLQHAIMAFLCITSAILVCRLLPTHESEHAPRFLILSLLILAVVGTFTLGNSPSILIGAFATALIVRCKPRFVLILGCMALVHTAVVLLTTTTAGVTQRNPIQVLKFSLVYLGAPFLRFDPWPTSYVTWWSSVDLAGFFGAAVLCTAVFFALVRFFVPGLGGKTAVFGFMILVIVIATGFAAAHSRAQFGLLEAANKKYASFSALGWLGTLAVFVGVARHMFGFLKRADVVVFAAILTFILPLGVSGYARETRLWQKQSGRVWEASLAAFLQINDRNRLHDLYTDEAGLNEYLGYVAPTSRGIYSYFPFRWGDDAKAFLSVRQKEKCRSEVESLNPIAAADLTTLFKVPGTPVSVSGWAWMDKERQPPESVIVVDSRDRIVGAARITRSSSRAEEWLGQKLDRDVGWFGFARLTEPQPVTFFALSYNGKMVCDLGKVGDVR